MLHVSCLRVIIWEILTGRVHFFTAAGYSKEASATTTVGPLHVWPPVPSQQKSSPWLTAGTQVTALQQLRFYSHCFFCHEIFIDITPFSWKERGVFVRVIFTLHPWKIAEMFWTKRFLISFYIFTHFIETLWIRKSTNGSISREKVTSSTNFYLRKIRSNTHPFLVEDIM